MGAIVSGNACETRSIIRTAILCFLMVATTCCSFGGTGECVYHDTRGNTSVTVTVKWRKCDHTEHRVEVKDHSVYVDGMLVLPETSCTVLGCREVESIDVSWNGKHVPLERAAYASIFDVDVDIFCVPPDVVIDEKEECVLVTRLGWSLSPGVLDLVVWRNGKWSRFVFPR